VFLVVCEAVVQQVIKHGVVFGRVRDGIVSYSMDGSGFELLWRQHFPFSVPLQTDTETHPGSCSVGKS
jgi:hypothetical protein